ncbi:MAG: ASCH domain-containing protein [Gemmataceae bacterium]
MPRRRALSLKQPWAALLVAGLKTIEIRRWSTAYRGPILIHAARLEDQRPEGWALLPPQLHSLAQQRQGILGEAQLVECRFYNEAESFVADQSLHGNAPEWFEPAGLYGLCFQDPRIVAFVPMPGFVRLFEIDWEEPSPPAPPSPPPCMNDRLSKLLRREIR